MCFTVESGCIEPVASQPLTFEIDSGNGLELFRLDNNAKPGNSIGLCTITSLKNRYGDWTVSFGKPPHIVFFSYTMLKRETHC